jgi:hypothetical protein
MKEPYAVGQRSSALLSPENDHAFPFRIVDAGGVGQGTGRGLEAEVGPRSWNRLQIKNF